jgi:hypothetical protein
MKENVQIHKLTWFFDFINRDLSSITIGDKMKLTTEAIEISYGIASYLFLDENLAWLPYDRLDDQKTISENIDQWEKENILESCQRHLRKYYENIIQVIDSSKKHAMEWKPALINYLTLAEKKASVTIKLETHTIESEKPKVINKGKKDEHKLYRLKEDSFLNSPIQLSIRAKNEKETLLLYFIQTLEGIPIRSLRQCPECGRYYVHLSKRPKIYCSNKCAARMGSREKRKWIKEHDPGSYQRELVKGKERALESYWRKRIDEIEGSISILQAVEKPKEKPKKISDQKLLPPPKTKKNK